MIYIAVIAAVVVLPIKFGGYGAIFQAAGEELARRRRPLLAARSRPG